MDQKGTGLIYKEVMEGLVAGKIDRELAFRLLKGLKQVESKGGGEIAIIGMALRFPGASTPAEFWEIVSGGVDCIGSLSDGRKQDADAYLRRVHGSDHRPSYIRAAFLEEIDRFDYRFFRLSPKEAALMDPCQRLFLQTVYHALEDAGYGGRRLSGSRIGVYLGFTTYPQGHYGSMLYYVDPTLLQSGMVGNIASLTPTRISYLLDLRGPTMVVDTACSSSLVTVYLACQALRSGDCGVAIAGGLRVNLLPYEDENLKFGVEAADGCTRAFDEHSTGSGVGEGAAALVLKPLHAAIRDGDYIYAVIKGAALNQDGSSIGITAPNPAAQEDVLVQAWKNANIPPETIQYIEAHGTGTRLGDPIEIDGLERAFAHFTDRRQFCAISSVKTNIGHLFECAGIASLIKAVLALKNRQIPPSLHFNRPNQRTEFSRSPVYVNTRLRPWETDGHPRRCGVSSFGLSGTNAHVVLEEYQAPADPPVSGGPHLLVLSARTRDVLVELVRSYRSALGDGRPRSIRSVCFTAGSGRMHLGCRIALVVQGVEDALERLERAERALGDPEKSPGFFYGEHKIVPETKQGDRAPEEITERERMQLSQAARQVIERYRSGGKQDTHLLEELACLYVQGADVDWDLLYEGEPVHRIPLPGYPFERERCWVEIPEAKPDEASVRKDGLFYTVRWVPRDLESLADVPPGGLYLLFPDPLGLGDQVAARLVGRGAEVIRVEVSGDPDEYGRLLDGLKGKRPRGVIHMATVALPGPVDSLAELERRQARGARELFHLLRALAARSMTEGLTLLLVSNYVFDVSADEPELKPENGPLLAMGKVIAREHPEMSVRAVDLDDSATADDILRELAAPHADYQVAYRSGKRYVEEFAALEPGARVGETIPIRQGGVYVITGGTGGIGLEVAALLASRARVRLALLNRTPMPDRSQWDRILEAGEDRQLCRKIRRIREIEAGGSQVLCLSADLSRPELVERALEEVRSRFGRINGVIHGAGLPQASPVVSREDDAFADGVFRPKVQGTWVLDHATSGDELDFFIMFSSIATIFSAVGQAEYVAANAYLDALAEARSRQGRRCLTINWATWKEVGMAADSGFTVDTIFKALTVARAMEGFGTLLDRPVDARRVLIGEMNYEGNGLLLLQRSGVRLSQPLQAAVDEHLSRTGRKVRALQVSRQEGSGEVRISGRSEGNYTPLERLIARVWAEVLGFAEIKIYDNYFELGGDSISGLKIANSIGRELNRPINPADLLMYTTVADLARHIEAIYGAAPGEAQPESDFPPLVPVEERPYYPVSPAQRGLYLLHQLEGIGTSYNVPNVQVIEGELDLDRFEAALRKLVAQHEALRTSFDFIDGEPVQIIHPTVELPLEHLDFSDCRDEAEALERARQIFAGFMRPFDLSRAPLFRCAVGRLSDRRFILIYDVHHIVSDGITLEIFGADLLKAYRGEELTPLPIQYKDYAVWMNELCNREFMRRQEQYWLAKLSGEIPVLDLPTDFPRPPFQRFEGGHVQFPLGREQTEALRNLVRETGTTLYVALLAVFKVLLWKYSRQEDIIVGSPVAGRPLPELEKVAGMFVNTLLIRSHPAGSKPFRLFLDEVHTTVVEALANQYYPFATLVEKLNVRRDLSRNALFDVMFVLQNYGVGESGWKEGLGVPVDMEADLFNNASKFDISIAALEVAGGIRFDVEYSTQLFKEERIRRLGRHFVRIVEEVTRNPAVLLSQIEITTPPEASEILDRFNATASPYEAEATLHGLFERQVARTPERTALIWEGGFMSYGELNRRANALAEILRSRGVGSEVLVAVMLERSPETVIAVLGVLKAGGAYLPIDPAYPEERIRYMLEDSGAIVLLTRMALAGKAPPDREVLCMDTLALDQGSEENLPQTSRPQDLAYVVYTSGTTGRPKGVMVEHRNAVAYVHAFVREFGPMEEQTVLQTASFSFDAFVEEVFPVLLHGGRLVIPDGMSFLDMGVLSRLTETYNITLLSTTPLLLGEINAAGGLPSVHTYISGGEVLKPEQVSNLVRRAKVYNTYGPTETTVCATYYRYTGETESRSIPIGSPVANYRAYVFDPDGRLAPVGVPGELYIAGAGVARGYLNQSELTAERFLTDPFVPGERMYRTGDFVRWLPDGTIEFLGRGDRQVKLRGFRVELGEVESCLSRHEAVREAVVTVFGEGESKALAAYLVADGELDEQALRQILRQQLPEYMIPSWFVFVEAIPKGANGKVDVSRLPRPDGRGNTGVPYVPPSTDQQVKIAEAWRQVLGLPRIGIDDNFFDLGANSIKAIQVVARLRTEFAITVNDIYLHQTVRTLAEAVTYNKENLRQQFELLKAAASPPAVPDAERIEVEEQLARYREGLKDYEQLDLALRISYGHILLAGGTGYLGAHLIRQLLVDTDGTLHLLVRGQSPESARQRLKARLDRYFGESLLEEYDGRIRVYNGDATQERLGLDADTYAMLAETVDCVINSAANIRHFGTYEDVYEVNVRGAERLIELAREGRPKDFNHISTISVASGWIEGRHLALMTEDDFDYGQVGDNNYVRTKIEAERAVRRARDEGLTVNIFRPGSVMFHSETGHFQENIGENAVYRMLRAFIGLGRMPALETATLDFSFVDCVAQAFTLLFDRAALRNQTHHLYNPTQISALEFADHVIACGYNFELMPLGEFLDWVYEHYHHPEMIEHIETLLPYAEPGSSTRFETRLDRTRLLLSRLGFEWPALTRAHVQRMLDHCKAVQFL